MNSVLPIGAFLYQSDGKPHLVGGVVLLMSLVIFIVCFDRLVVKKDSGTQRKIRLRQNILKKASLPKRFWYSVLQIVDLFVGLYFCRGTTLNNKPYRKATETEKRVGGCFMVLWPFIMTLMMGHTDSFGAMVDSMMYGRHWIGWLYLGYMALIGSALFFAIKIAPKIPLQISVPAAVISWLFLAWTVWTSDLI
jgi:hypothetical protein